MPQLDKFSFIPQIGWLILVFLTIYFVLLHFVLPQLSSVLKTRSKKLNFLKSDLIQFTNLEVTLQKEYYSTVNHFINYTNLILSHLKSNLDNHLQSITTYIKANVYF